MTTADIQGQPAENQLWRGRGSYLAMLGECVLFGALALGAIIVGTLLLRRHPALLSIIVIVALAVAVWVTFRVLYFRWATGYRLSDQRLFIDRGLLWRVTDQTELIRVDDVQIRQGPLDRLFKIGDVVITSADASDARLVIRGIAEPTTVAEHIRTHTRRLRQQKGLYIESI